MRWSAAEGLGQAGVGNEAVVFALLEALHDGSWPMRWSAAESLGQVGVGNEAVARALLAALHDADSDVRWQAAVILGRLEIKNLIQLRRVLVALNSCLHNEHNYMRPVRPFDKIYMVRLAALSSIRQLLDGRPIPGYRWKPLRKQRAQKRQLKRIAFWLGVTAVIVMIGLAATWLLGVLDPNGFPVRFLTVLAGIIAFAAAVAQVLGRTLRNPWDHS